MQAVRHLQFESGEVPALRHAAPGEALMSDLTSRPFRPDPQQACERCCFGSGYHAYWCELGEPAWIESMVRLPEIIKLQRDYNEALSLQNKAVKRAR